MMPAFQLILRMISLAIAAEDIAGYCRQPPSATPPFAGFSCRLDTPLRFE
jgi:hypothetical protein